VKKFKTIQLEEDKNYAILRFNRPKQGNGFNEEMGLELLEAFHQLAAPQVRSVVWKK